MSRRRDRRSLNVRSCTGTIGRLRRSDCQRAPSSNETHTPRSVPATSSPRLSGSSRTTRVNSVGVDAVVDTRPRLAAVRRLPEIRTHCRRAGSDCRRRTRCTRRSATASMLETRVNFADVLRRDVVPFAPPSRVRCTLPSSEPVQITLVGERRLFDDEDGRVVLDRRLILRERTARVAERRRIVVGEIGRDGGPALSAVRRLVHDVRAGVHDVRVVLRER